MEKDPRIMNELTQAADFLRKADPKLAKVIDRLGPCALGSQPNTFETLAEIIVGQQLSGKAADSIFRKVKLVCEAKTLTPSALIRRSDEELRGAGLSAAKVRAIRSLTEHVQTRKLQIKRLESFDDERVTEIITAVKGMGPWSAQMYLMFVLNRLDVFPVRDLGIRKGMMQLYGSRISEKRMLKISEKWRPYRTIASWYLWRSLDNRPDSE
jgi:DNA-3-methyladenine glycosylase II